MFVKNTTFVVHRSVDNQFVDWARDVYVPSISGVAGFSDVTMMKVLTEIDPDTVNYAIQFRTQSLSQVEEWETAVASFLKDDISRLTRGMVVSFSTSMEIIE